MIPAYLLSRNNKALPSLLNFKTIPTLNMVDIVTVIQKCNFQNEFEHGFLLTLLKTKIPVSTYQKPVRGSTRNGLIWVEYAYMP